jgi:hypothetical protein
VISERTFAQSELWVWQHVAPRVGDVLRYLNANARNYAPEVSVKVSPARRTFISDLSFRVAEVAHAAGMEVVDVCEAGRLEPIIVASSSYVSRLTQEESVVRALSSREREAIVQEAANIVALVHGEGSSVQWRPPFRGCSRVIACEGDVLGGRVLWELKSRGAILKGRASNFEPGDLRQCMVYAALDYAAGLSRFDAVGLCNPLIGRSIVIGVDKLCLDAAGASGPRVLSLIAENMEASIPTDQGVGGGT